eukprot:XP_001691628.1 predicted protein [Chlamydomonas reinhardtii]
MTSLASRPALHNVAGSLLEPCKVPSMMELRPPPRISLTSFRATPTGKLHPD